MSTKAICRTLLSIFTSRVLLRPDSRQPSRRSMSSSSKTSHSLLTIEGFGAVISSRSQWREMSLVEYVHEQTLHTRKVTPLTLLTSDLA